jgi:hypothetical protein
MPVFSSERRGISVDVIGMLLWRTHLWDARP